MIPTQATDGQLAGYVANIVAAYRSATPDQVARGRTWYQTANELASVIGDGNVAMGAGVLAALSAQRPGGSTASWPPTRPPAIFTARPTQVLDKVRRDAGRSRPGHRSAHDQKTGNFYACILDPADPDPVCVDRHAP